MYVRTVRRLGLTQPSPRCIAGRSLMLYSWWWRHRASVKRKLKKQANCWTGAHLPCATWRTESSSGTGERSTGCWSRAKQRPSELNNFCRLYFQPQYDRRSRDERGVEGSYAIERTAGRCCGKPLADNVGQSRNTHGDLEINHITDRKLAEAALSESEPSGGRHRIGYGFDRYCGRVTSSASCWVNGPLKNVPLYRKVRRWGNHHHASFPRFHDAYAGHIRRLRKRGGAMNWPWAPKMYCGHCARIHRNFRSKPPSLRWSRGAKSCSLSSCATLQSGCRRSRPWSRRRRA